jgi:hypothetical protein
MDDGVEVPTLEAEMASPRAGTPVLLTRTFSLSCTIQ